MCLQQKVVTTLRREGPGEKGRTSTGVDSKSLLEERGQMHKNAFIYIVPSGLSFPEQPDIVFVMQLKRI